MSQAQNKPRKFSETLSDAVAYMGAYFTAEEGLDHNMAQTDGQRYYQKIHSIVQPQVQQPEVQKKVIQHTVIPPQVQDTVHQQQLKNIRKNSLATSEGSYTAEHKPPIGHHTPMLYNAIRVDSQKSMYESLGGRIF